MNLVHAHSINTLYTVTVINHVYVTLCMTICVIRSDCFKRGLITPVTVLTFSVKIWHFVINWHSHSHNDYVSHSQNVLTREFCGFCFLFAWFRIIPCSLVITHMEERNTKKSTVQGTQVVLLWRSVYSFGIISATSALGVLRRCDLQITSVTFWEFNSSTTIFGRWWIDFSAVQITTGTTDQLYCGKFTILTTERQQDVIGDSRTYSWWRGVFGTAGPWRIRRPWWCIERTTLTGLLSPHNKRSRHRPEAQSLQTYHTIVIFISTALFMNNIINRSNLDKQ